jgi:hypothetical protein
VETSGSIFLDVPSYAVLPSRLCRGWWAINCERTPFWVVQAGAIARLDHHVSRGVRGCARHSGKLESMSLIPISAVLDERRLSAMAAHPSALQTRLSAQPVEHSVDDEELPE